MEQRLHVGPPEPGSEREKEFEDSAQYLRDTVMRVVKQRRDGTESREIPFIDALLQTQVPDKQVNRHAFLLPAFTRHCSKIQAII